MYRKHVVLKSNTVSFIIPSFKGNHDQNIGKNPSNYFLNINLPPQAPPPHAH